METVGPLSCGFIYVGLPERSRTDYQASNISTYISFNHFNLNRKFMGPPHLSAPTPKLVSSLVLRVSASTATWARNLGAVLGPSSFLFCLMEQGWLLTKCPFIPFPIAHRQHPDFLWGITPPPCICYVVWVTFTLFLANCGPWLVRASQHNSISPALEIGSEF